MNIIGAGIAGLMAGSIFQRATIFESGPESQMSHKAVLRFRSSAVGEAVGVEFKKVIVNKGLWIDERFVAPNIQLANLYSKKVIGRLADRSIWKLEPVERFVAPDDLVQRMAERCAGRIHWNTPVTLPLSSAAPTISTIPMDAMAKMLGIDTAEVAFSYAPIKVRRWRVPGANVFQTVYFPSPETNLYRASITGDLLIAEYKDEEDDHDFLPAFGLTHTDVVAHDSTKQRYGKIAPINERWRKSFIMNVSDKHNIYSVGRFSTWRNILLDDALKDIHIVKRLIEEGSYARALHGR